MSWRMYSAVALELLLARQWLHACSAATANLCMRLCVTRGVTRSLCNRASSGSGPVVVSAILCQHVSWFLSSV